MTAFRREYLVLAVLCLMFGNPELRAQEEPLCVEKLAGEARRDRMQYR